MFQIKVEENIATRILHPITFFPKSCRSRDVEKYGAAKHATDHSTIGASVLHAG